MALPSQSLSLAAAFFFFFFKFFFFFLLVDLQCLAISFLQQLTQSHMYIFFFSHYAPSCSIPSDQL